MVTFMTDALEEHAMDFFESLPVLKKNVEAVPEEELNGRYRKAFERMKRKVLTDADAFLLKIISQEMVFKNKEDMESIGVVLRGEWNDILNMEEQRGLYDRLSDILFRRCSVHDYLSECLRLSELLRAGCYRDYWTNHCSYAGGLWYNDILDMYWRGGEWRSVKGRIGYPNGRTPSTPPTQESCHAKHVCEMEDLNRLCGLAGVCA